MFQRIQFGRIISKMRRNWRLWQSLRISSNLVSKPPRNYQNQKSLSLPQRQGRLVLQRKRNLIRKRRRRSSVTGRRMNAKRIERKRHSRNRSIVGNASNQSSDSRTMARRVYWIWYGEYWHSRKSTTEAQQKESGDICNSLYYFTTGRYPDL